MDNNAFIAGLEKYACEMTKSAWSLSDMFFDRQGFMNEAQGKINQTIQSYMPHAMGLSFLGPMAANLVQGKPPTAKAIGSEVANQLVGRLGQMNSFAPKAPQYKELPKYNWRLGNK